MKPKEFSLILNNEQKLYVIGVAAGITCLGFDVCQERSIALAKWLGVEAPNSSYWGTTQGYERYRELVELCRERYLRTKERCPCELTPQLVGLERKKVEVVDKWGETRVFWVGKSTGWIPCHLEIEKRSDSGGSAVVGAPFKSVKVLPR